MIFKFKFYKFDAVGSCWASSQEEGSERNVWVFLEQIILCLKTGIPELENANENREHQRCTEISKQDRG